MIARRTRVAADPLGHRTVLSLLLIVLGVAGLANQGCTRKVPKPSAEEQADQETEGSIAISEREKTAGREVYASWYDVPDTSLAKRRAGLEEMTAAHNRLPLGTMVRVTHLANGKSVLVRITDRGITDRKIKLDLCKEAAHELGMVSKGIARVRMQVVTEKSGPETTAAN